MNAIDNIGRGFDGLPGPVRAAFWLVCASTSFLLMMALARVLSGDIDMLVIVFWRAVFGIMFMLPWLARNGLGVMRTGKIKGHMLRTVMAYGGMLCMFYAATMMPLADITSIAFARPILASMLAIMILGEPMLARRWGATAAGLIGALIIIRPGFIEFNAGIWVVTGAVVINSGFAVMAKYLLRTDAPDTTAMYMTVFLTPLALVPALFVWQWPTLEQFMWLLLFGALGMASQRSLVRAYHAADATLVLSFDFLKLPLAAFIGFVLFSELPDFWVWVGGSVICASAVYITRRESRLGSGTGA
jgi:drug/metabolite transporter (DMT)-like permease